MGKSSGKAIGVIIDKNVNVNDHLSKVCLKGRQSPKFALFQFAKQNLLQKSVRTKKNTSKKY